MLISEIIRNYYILVNTKISSVRFLYQRSIKESREHVCKLLNRNLGPTIAFEDAQMRFGALAPSLDAVRMMASRLNSMQDWNQDEIQSLLLMREVYENEISDAIIPGYIQELSLEPIRVLLYSAEQLRFSLNCLRSPASR